MGSGHPLMSCCSRDFRIVIYYALCSCGLCVACAVQVVNVLGFSLPFYRSPTLLLSLGLSVRVLYFLITQRPDVIHVSSPGLLVFAATLYAKLLAIPLVVSAFCQAAHL